MRHVHDQQYVQFTPIERLNLTLAALARGDESEANRLWQTCPRYRYQAHDFAYTLMFDAVIILNSIFFEKCVSHYNIIKKMDEFILETEHDLSFEEKEKIENQTEKIINIAQHTKDFHIARMQGLFEGFKMFCTEAYLIYENIINITSIKNCCHEIDSLLAAEIKIDMQYASQMKDFFLEYWHF